MPTTTRKQKVDDIQGAEGVALVHETHAGASYIRFCLCVDYALLWILVHELRPCLEKVKGVGSLRKGTVPVEWWLTATSL